MKFTQKTQLFLLASSLVKGILAECPNNCSGHGQCGSHDMCTCDRNWQGEDCSLRTFRILLSNSKMETSILEHGSSYFSFTGTCPFGLAHVDISKGDLDSSQSIDGSTSIVITDSTVYPFGTTEGYPHMTDTAGVVYPNTAHEYSECSNKGLCDRKFGECICFPGYDGAACQRASCPSQLTPNSPTFSFSDLASSFGNQFPSSSSFLGNAPTANSVFSGNAPSSGFVPPCSGHGVCRSISAMASSHGDDKYNLWDKESTMGCVCDPGYVISCILRMVLTSNVTP